MSMLCQEEATAQKKSHRILEAIRANALSELGVEPSNGKHEVMRKSGVGRLWGCHLVPFALQRHNASHI